MKGKIRLSLFLMLMSMTVFLLFGAQVCSASPIISPQGAYPSDEYFDVSDSLGGKINLSIAQMDLNGRGTLNFKLGGNSGTYQDLDGTSYNYGQWNSMGKGSGGIDFQSLPSSFTLDFKLALPKDSYGGARMLELREGYNSWSTLGSSQGILNIVWDTNNNHKQDSGDKAVTVTLVGNTAVPIPPTAWLLGSGLLGLIGFRRTFRG